MASIQTKSRKRQKTARKASKPRTTPADRRLLKQAAAEQAEDKAPPAPPTPAQIIREAKARATHAACFEGGTPESIDRLDAAERDADVLVPLRMGLLCRIIGVDCKAENFAPTALMELSRQIDALSDLADESADGGYENWKLVQNLSARAALAGRVAAWLEEPGPAAELPEVEP